MKLYDTQKNAIPDQSTQIKVAAPEASGINISSQVIEDKIHPGEYTISINGTKSGEVEFTVSQNPVLAGNPVSYSLKVIDANNNPLEEVMVSWR
ncbi:hypothetical protein [Xenorhabdus szentirmaii]|uniref:Uncharacterized protein n=1 Tax=Xenorhabdus szentirmaii DSM 16338 TaxID=1427518 RepID=W1IUJ2_9GAMM|nr:MULTISPECIES: hypothetical protein [Xenorhabdus]MBD2806184.1 hypothetical protein [Xenorhabdus sp. ZM]CDL81291.1 hypothetical protein XSR1_120023 [Xenorhabdus szentirmaii DSM 16338]